MEEEKKEELLEAPTEEPREETEEEVASRVVDLMEKRDHAGLKELIESQNAPDLALIFAEVPEEYYPRLFRFMPKELAAETFVEMDSELQEKIVNCYTDRELSALLGEMYLDDTVDLIEEMPANVVKRILRASKASDRDTINQLLKYPKDSAGTIMTTEYVRFRKDMTVEEALTHLRKVAIDKETIYTCYVTDKDRHLLGIVTAKSLLIASLDAVLSDIMEDSAVIFAKTTDDKEDVAQLFEKYGFLALPVVDNEQRLVGIVTVDDAIDVLHEEAEEDFAKMAGIKPTETTYLKTSALAIFRSRVPWLLILMISATFSSMILNFFEKSLAAVFVLFVPMLMDTGGNSGGQASVTIIRGLSLGELGRKDVLSVLWKELRVGLLCGASLGAVAFGKVLLVDHLIMANPSVTVLVALAVAVSLCLTIVVAKMIGCTLPIFASAIGFDPAVMASPFITTIVDIVSLLIYFVIASQIGLPI